MNGQIEVDNLIVDGNVKINEEYRNNNSSNSTFNYLDILPRGSIVPWMRQYIPSGWAICDGTKLNDIITTPNLCDLPYNVNTSAYTNKLNKENYKKNIKIPGLYISGTDNKSNIDKHGGKSTFDLTLNHLPKHNHKLAMKYTDTETNGLRGFYMNVDKIILGGDSNFIYSTFDGQYNMFLVNYTGVNVKVIYIIKL
jgi:hypothetical protein